MQIMVGLNAMILVRICITIFLLLGTSAFAEDSAKDKAYWLCKNKKEVRTIRVHIDSKNVCSTIYTKQGEQKVVGSGKNHESCMKFLDGVKTNLEKSNYSCRDISDTTITSLME